MWHIVTYIEKRCIRPLVDLAHHRVWASCSLLSLCNNKIVLLEKKKSFNLPQYFAVFVIFRQKTKQKTKNKKQKQKQKQKTKQTKNKNKTKQMVNCKHLNLLLSGVPRYLRTSTKMLKGKLWKYTQINNFPPFRNSFNSWQLNRTLIWVHTKVWHRLSTQVSTLVNCNIRFLFIFSIICKFDSKDLVKDHKKSLISF